MQEPKQIKHKNKHAQAPKHPEQLLGTYGNLLNLKKHEIFDLKKNVLWKEERKKNKAVFRFASND